MDILDSAEKILENDRDVIVPLSRLWTAVMNDAVSVTLTLEEFTAAVTDDERFELVTGEWPDIGADGNDENRSSDPATRPYVKLRRVKITPGLLAGVMSAKVEDAINALMEAWEKRPSGDKETEEQLLEILQQAKVLKQDLEQLKREESGHERKTKNDK